MNSEKHNFPIIDTVWQMTSQSPSIYIILTNRPKPPFWKKIYNLIFQVWEISLMECHYCLATKKNSEENTEVFLKIISASHPHFECRWLGSYETRYCY